MVGKMRIGILKSLKKCPSSVLFPLIPEKKGPYGENLTIIFRIEQALNNFHWPS